MTARIVEGVEDLCQCGFTADQIVNGAFRCFTPDSKNVTFRGGLLGTSDSSTTSLSLASFIQEWAEAQDAIPVQGLQLNIVDTCAVVIGTLDEEECRPIPTEGPTSTLMTTEGATTEEGGRDNTGLIVGVVVGVIVAIVIIIIIVIVIIAAVIFFVLGRKKKTYKLKHE